MIALNARYEFVLLLVLSVVFTDCGYAKGKRPSVAIIGGGIGGTVTAYELSKLAAKSGHDIILDLYEPGEIGGRLATTKVNGHEFETGGSIIHIKNEHMTNYVLKNGLHWYTEPRGHTKEERTGMYDGKEFIFVSSKYQYWDMIRLFWRYGFDITSFERDLVKPMLSHFERIYEAQEENMRFDDVHSLLAYMSEDFEDLMKVELDQCLRSNGYSDRFIEEIIFLATNINYNQNTNIPAFVGFVALAGAQGNNLRSVEGGNKLVPKILLAKSDARLIKSRVQSVTLTPDSKYALGVDSVSYVYDYVVIACPLIENSENKIAFQGFSGLNISLNNYQKTVATLVHGELNHTFFHYDSPEGLPNDIFSVNIELFFNSISVLDPVIFDSNYDRKVFKIFSKDTLTDEQLNLLFLSRDIVTVIPWLAYPLYDTEDRNLSFVLHDNLFYVNAIEWAASAMEMSAISGFNVAIHIHQRLENDN